MKLCDLLDQNLVQTEKEMQNFQQCDYSSRLVQAYSSRRLELEIADPVADSRGVHYWQVIIRTVNSQGFVSIIHLFMYT